MLEFLNKKISTPIAITIIILLTLLVGALMIYQYQLLFEEISTPPPIVFLSSSAETVIVTTDKTGYEQGKTVKITVRNNLDKDICIESCNSYHLEKKNSEWEWSIFLLCEQNFISECIGPKGTKTFEQETAGYTLTAGLYRIAIPICIDCKELMETKESFYRIDETIYSNEFTIK